jgi:hypothetical protein
MWAALLLMASVVFAPGDHVSFVVMGKTTNHRQSESGELGLLNYHFFAEIFVREGGSVGNASLTFPAGEVETFEAGGSVLELHGGRFDHEEALDRKYPAGEYRLRFETPGGAVEGMPLRMRGARIPKGPRIVFQQGGRPVSPKSIDPAEELTVTWSEFEGARSDPNAILDDLVFVVVGNCHAERVVHSGRPFEGTPFLTYRTMEYRIPGGKLSPGESHQMFVELAAVDTIERDGIVGLVTYAATTFLDFQTLGSPAGRPCPEVMPAFDGGQTDRKRPRAH